MELRFRNVLLIAALFCGTAWISRRRTTKSPTTPKQPTEKAGSDPGGVSKREGIVARRSVLRSLRRTQRLQADVEARQAQEVGVRQSEAGESGGAGRSSAEEGTGSSPRALNSDMPCRRSTGKESDGGCLQSDRHADQRTGRSGDVFSISKSKIRIDGEACRPSGRQGTRSVCRAAFADSS